jgi:hypothetical protein
MKNDCPETNYISEMKKLYLSCILCFFLGMAYAQTQAPALFNPKAKFNQPVERAVSRYSAFDIDYQVLASLYQSKPATLQLQLPFEGKLMTLNLKQTKITTDNFSVVVSDDRNHATRSKKATIPLGVFYAGTIEGSAKSVASIAIFDNQVIGVLSNEAGNINLGALENAGNPTGEYILYREQALNAKNPFACATSEIPVDEGTTKVTPNAQKTNAVGQPIEFYFECDYALFLSKSSSVPNVINYVLGFFNNTAQLYDVENVKVQVSQIKVWTNTDPYVGYSTTGTLLPAFSADMVNANYVGDFAHFLSTRSLGGGVAYLLNNPCSTTRQFTNAVSGINTTYSNIPTFSWTVEVVTHEMGHNLGSNHTQWCGWTGGALDNCYTTEGGCSPGPQPANGGTIMSYCHLTSTGINLSNGFGTQPGNKIRSVIASATCYGTCKMTINIAPTNIGCGNTTGSATVTPTNGSGVYTYLWSNGQTAQTATGLAAGTYYVSVKDNTGCEVINNVTISSQGGITPSISAVGPNTICGNGSVVLSTPVNASYTSYQWYKGTTIIPGANQSTYTATEGGSYYVKVTTATCAGQSTNLTVTITPNPTVVVTPAVATIKKYATQVLTASGADSYNWASQPGYMATISNNSASFKPLQNTTYTIRGTMTAGGCSATAQATINVIGCGDVTDTLVTTYSPSRVMIKWKNPADVLYDSAYYRAAGSTGAWSAVYVMGESVELSGLMPNTRYDYYITALCATTNTFVPSPQGAFTTPALSEDVYLRVFPNPIVNRVSRVEVIVKEETKATITLVNTIGQQLAVIANNVTLPKGQSLFPVKIPALVKGTYFVAITINGKKYVKAVMQE